MNLRIVPTSGNGLLNLEVGVAVRWRPIFYLGISLFLIRLILTLEKDEDRLV